MSGVEKEGVEWRLYRFGLPSPLREKERDDVAIGRGGIVEKSVAGFEPTSLLRKDNVKPLHYATVTYDALIAYNHALGYD